jgi:hypothetical protein
MTTPTDPNTITLGPLQILWALDGDDPGVGLIEFFLNADGYECFAQFPRFGSTGLSPATWEAIKAALKDRAS